MASILCVQRAQISQLPAGPDGRRGVRGPGGALGVRLLELARAADGRGGEGDVRETAALQDGGGAQVSPAEEEVMFISSGGIRIRRTKVPVVESQQLPFGVFKCPVNSWGYTGGQLLIFDKRGFFPASYQNETLKCN